MLLIEILNLNRLGKALTSCSIKLLILNTESVLWFWNSFWISLFLIEITGLKSGYVFFKICMYCSKESLLIEVPVPSENAIKNLLLNSVIESELALLFKK